MRLYHFTSEAAAALIQVEGIKPTYIHVPRQEQSRYPVVSLTADPDPTPLMKKSLWDGTELSGDALGGYLAANPGAVVPIIGSNTVAQRIHLEVPEHDGNLFMLEYPDIAALGFTDQVLRACILTTVGMPHWPGAACVVTFGANNGHQRKAGSARSDQPSAALSLPCATYPFRPPDPSRSDGLGHAVSK